MSFEIRINKAIGDCQISLALASHAPLIALVGPSGAGKTTILNCIAGLETPDNGHIEIAGITLFDSHDGTDIPANKRGCGYVFQDNRLFPHKSVDANLKYGQPRAHRHQMLNFETVVRLLDIAHLLDRSPANLSGGEMRRVAIGRALLSGPEFLLLDEPLTSLDPNRSDHILTTIERLRDTLSIPMVYVSHDMAEIARLTDAVFTLD